MTQFPDFGNLYGKDSGQRNKRRLLLAVCEIEGNNVIGAEKIFTGTDISQFKNLPKEIYDHILTLCEEVDQKKAKILADKPKVLEDKSTIDI